MMRDTQARTLVISDIGRTLLDNFHVVYRIGIGNFPVLIRLVKGICAVSSLAEQVALNEHHS
jgi:hypothetical protein